MFFSSGYSTHKGLRRDWEIKPWKCCCLKSITVLCTMCQGHHLQLTDMIAQLVTTLHCYWKATSLKPVNPCKPRCFGLLTRAFFFSGFLCDWWSRWHLCEDIWLSSVSLWPWYAKSPQTSRPYFPVKTSCYGPLSRERFSLYTPRCSGLKGLLIPRKHSCDLINNFLQVCYCLEL